MPYKANLTKRHHFKKHIYRQTNYSDYNNALKNRGRIDVWISDDVLDCWQNDERIYDGTGSSKKYPNSTIETCHYLRMVFKRPLRQTQGFIEDLLEMLGRQSLQCPDYTLLSKRLSSLGLTSPKFKRGEGINSDIVAIAIDSTGLKQFGKDEWHKEKHKVNGKRSWRKAHLAVRVNHIIDSAVLTHKDTMDDQVVEAICTQITEPVSHVTADKMYDTDAVYQTLDSYFPKADIVIPPKDSTFADDGHQPKRMINLVAYMSMGVARWQKLKHYGWRNVSEMAMQRYKKIIGPKLHSRNISNQTQEMLIGCSILNRLTHLGMPNSYRVA
ncbi:IS5 family transposase [Photobacterium damselae]|uniref:IS5 family transposase n=1 Tax=Photobacterium damselae TaxID=38293 RepID=UPI004068E582